MTVNDWVHEMAEDHVPGTPNTSIITQSILINGKGQTRNVSVYQIKKYRIGYINSRLFYTYII